jgi:SAM-dependent methyltransferase
MAQPVMLSAVDEYMASNRSLWEEWTPIHARSEFYDVEGWKANHGRMWSFVAEEVGDVAGRDLLHLQCHFGLDTLTWAWRGARVTGVDFSERSIELARSLAAESGLGATFVRADVLELPAVLRGDFDIVFTTFGVLGWLPDLSRWAEVIAHFLRPEGFVYVADMHPFALVLDDDEGTTEPRLRYPYFPSPKPLSLPVRGSYADRKAEVLHPVEYYWAHSMGEIVTALAQVGLCIKFLHEFPFAVEKQLPFLIPDDGQPALWTLPPNLHGRMPLIFSLKATKPIA